MSPLAVGRQSLPAGRRVVVRLSVTLIICITTLIYCLFSAAVIDDHSTHSMSSSRASLLSESNAMRSTVGQQRWTLFDNESAALTVRSATLPDVNSSDQYDHYSARLSRVSRHSAKDALHEICLLYTSPSPRDS